MNLRILCMLILSKDRTHGLKDFYLKEDLVNYSRISFSSCC
jgi:hypothetical protein